MLDLILFFVFLVYYFSVSLIYIRRSNKSMFNDFSNFDDFNEKEFGAILLRLINSRGTNQVDVSKKSDIDRKTLGKICNGEIAPSIKHLYRISKVFGVDASIFFGGAGKNISGPSIDKNEVNLSSAFCHYDCAAIYLTMYDKGHDFASISMSYLEDREKRKMCGLFTDVKCDSRTIHINKGDFIVHYPHDSRIIKQGQTYVFKGYEDSFSVKVGTKISLAFYGISVDDTVKIFKAKDNFCSN